MIVNVDPDNEKSEFPKLITFWYKALVVILSTINLANTGVTDAEAKLVQVINCRSELALSSAFIEIIAGAS